MKSFRSLSVERDSIRKLMSNPSSKLSDVIRQLSFMGLWSIQDQQLVNYVVNHFGEVIDLAFQLAPNAEPALVSRAVKIITVQTKSVRSLYFEKAKLGEFLLEFVTGEEALDSRPHNVLQAYFNLLPMLAFDERQKLAPILDNDVFFITLFRRVDIFPVFVFVQRLVASPPSGAIPVLKRIDFGAILVKNLVEQPVLRLRSQMVLKRVLEGSVHYGIASALTERGSLDKIVEIGVNDKGPAIFAFLRQVARISGTRYWSRDWRSVQSLIAKHLVEFCQVILNDDGFNKNSESCTRLVCMIFASSGVVTPEIRSVVLHLSQRFFELPQNSFLHNCFVAALAELAKHRRLTDDLVKEMDLCKKIISQYKQRDAIVTACNWGQMREISHLIDVYARRDECAQEWERVVCQENIRTERIISMTFGESKSSGTCSFFLKGLALIALSIFVNFLLNTWNM